MQDSGIEHTPHREPRGIAIVAFGASRDLTPWDSGEWFFWTLNDAYAHFARRISTIFEMHPPSHYNEDGLYVRDHEARLEQIAAHGGCDVILAFPNPKIPHGKLYPYDDVVAAFKREYFLSSLAYMIPLAILSIEESVKAKDGRLLPRLGIWGADMQLTSEYAKERACVEYWLARAEERGIELTIDPSCPLLKAGYRYGYETVEVDRRSKLVEGRQRELMNLIREDERMIEERKRIADERRGMLSETAWFSSVFTTQPHAAEQQK